MKQKEEVARSLDNEWHAVSTDIEKLAKFNRTKKDSIVSRQKEIEELVETREMQLETVAGLESDIADLRDVCLHEKHIDPDNDDRVNYVIKDLEDQIQDLRQRVFTSDETKWKVEMAKGKGLAQQDKLFLSFNRALVEVGEGTRLEPSTHGPQDVRQFLHNLNSQLKAADRTLHTQTEGV